MNIDVMIRMGMCLAFLVATAGCRAPAARPDTSAILPPTTSKQALLNDALAGLVFGRDSIEIDEGHVKVRENRKGQAHRLNVQARALLERNHSTEAIGVYRDAILSDPDNSDSYVGLGDALMTKGKTEYAVAGFFTALRITPEDLDARATLAAALARLQRLDESVVQWQKVLDRDPNYPDAHARLAIAYYLSGDHEQAWRHAHAAEAIGQQVPPQFRVQLERHAPEP